MKKCPFCGEKIQNEAKKCRYCGERIETKEEKKQYQEGNQETHSNNKAPGYIKDLEKIATVIAKIKIIHNIKSFFLKYIRFQKQKRVGRRGFGWMFFSFLIGLILAGVMTIANSDFLNILSFIIYISLLILLIEKIIKRFHDIGMGMSLIYVIIVISIAIGTISKIEEFNNITLLLKGIIGLIIIYITGVLFLRKGIDGENKWGTKPKI